MTPWKNISGLCDQALKLSSTSQGLITYLTIQEAVKYWHKETLQRRESSQLLGKSFNTSTERGDCPCSWAKTPPQHPVPETPQRSCAMADSSGGCPRHSLGVLNGFRWFYVGKCIIRLLKFTRAQWLCGICWQQWLNPCNDCKGWNSCEWSSAHLVFRAVIIVTIKERLPVLAFLHTSS